MTQAERISAKVGGNSELAKLCGVHPSQVSRWDFIPARHHQKILDGAPGKVTPEDFFDAEPGPARRRRSEKAA